MFHASPKSSSELNVLVLWRQVTEEKYIRNWLRHEMESFMKRATKFDQFTILNFQKMTRTTNGCWNPLAWFLQEKVIFYKNFVFE